MSSRVKLLDVCEKMFVEFNHCDPLFGWDLEISRDASATSAFHSVSFSEATPSARENSGMAGKSTATASIGSALEAWATFKGAYGCHEMDHQR